MNKKIQRNYLEINSLRDLKDSKNSPEGYVVQIVQPSDFQLNNFFIRILEKNIIGLIDWLGLKNSGLNIFLIKK